MLWMRVGLWGTTSPLKWKMSHHGNEQDTWQFISTDVVSSLFFVAVIICSNIISNIFNGKRVLRFDMKRVQIFNKSKVLVLIVYSDVHNSIHIPHTNKFSRQLQFVVITSRKHTYFVNVCFTHSIRRKYSITIYNSVIKGKINKSVI